METITAKIMNGNSALLQGKAIPTRKEDQPVNKADIFEELGIRRMD